LPKSANYCHQLPSRLCGVHKQQCLLGTDEYWPIFLLKLFLENSPVKLEEEEDQPNTN
jgi:hypothetical protein